MAVDSVMRRSAWTGLALILAATAIEAQTSNVVCNKDSLNGAGRFLLNSDEESPCVVWSKVLSLCMGPDGAVNVQPLRSDKDVYPGPQDPLQTACACNDVSYNLMAACSFCQGSDIFLSEDRFARTCRTYSIQGLGFAQNQVNVPLFAFVPSQGQKWGFPAILPSAVPVFPVTTTISRFSEPPETAEDSTTTTSTSTSTPLISITPTPVPTPTSYITIASGGITTSSISSSNEPTKSQSKPTSPSAATGIPPPSSSASTNSTAGPPDPGDEAQQANASQNFKSKAAPILGSLGAFAALMMLAFALLNRQTRRKKRMFEGREILPVPAAGAASRNISKPDNNVKREDSFLRLYMRSGMSRLNSVSFSQTRPAPPPPGTFAGLLARRNKAAETLRKGKGKAVEADEKGLMTAQAKAMRGSAPDWRQDSAPAVYPFTGVSQAAEKQFADEVDVARAY